MMLKWHSACEKYNCIVFTHFFGKNRHKPTTMSTLSFYKKCRSSKRLTTNPAMLLAVWAKSSEISSKRNCYCWN